MAAALAVDGVTLTPHEQAGMFVVAGREAGELRGLVGAGVAQVQGSDCGDGCVALECAAGTDVARIDVAGLGTKSCKCSKRVGKSGRVVAMDSA